MRPSKESFRAAKSLAETKGYDIVKYEEAREDCVIYYVGHSYDAGCTIGYPFFVIVDTAFNARFTGHEEVWGW